LPVFAVRDHEEICIFVYLALTNKGKTLAIVDASLNFKGFNFMKHYLQKALNWMPASSLKEWRKWRTRFLWKLMKKLETLNPEDVCAMS